MRKKLLAIVVLACIMVSVFPLVANAKNYAKIYQPTNIRTATSVQAQVITRINPPKQLEIISETKDKDGKIWFKVALEKGKSGFVASWVVTKIVIGEEQKLEGMKAIIDPGNGSTIIRSAPNSKSSVLYKVSAKAELTIISKIKGDDGKDWYKVKLDSTKSGYVPVSSVNDTTSNSVKKQTINNLSLVIDPLVNLRSGPSTKSSVVTKTTSRITTKAVSQSKDADGMVWYEITLPTSVNAWVRQDLSSPVTPEKESQVSNLRAVISKNINIRADASISSKKVFTTNATIEVPVLGKKNDINGQVWYRIKGSFGEGWVLGKLLNIESSSPYDIVDKGAKLRLSPNQGGVELSVATRQSKCTVSGSSISTSGETWYLVTTDIGNTGWVSSANIKLASNPDLPPTNILGINVEIQKETKLATFPSGEDGSPIFAGGKGKVDAVAIREGGKLFYRLISGNKAGWVSAGTTKMHTQPIQVKPVDVGEITWKKHQDILEFRIPISGKVQPKVKNYDDNPRIQLYMENGIYTDSVNTKVIDSTLVSRVGINQQSISPPRLLITFQLNKPADFHIKPITPTSEEIVIEVFERVQKQQIAVQIHGTPMIANDPPKMIEDKILLPLYALETNLGCLVQNGDVEGSAILQSDKVSITFVNEKPTIQIVEGKIKRDVAVSPAPKVFENSMYVPIEPICQYLGFQYTYSPVKNTVYLDPVIDKLEIGGCGENAKSCNTLESQISYFTDYDKTELSDGRILVTLNNSVLGATAAKDLDKNRVQVEFNPRTNAQSPKVMLYIKKKENEVVVFGESKNPNKLIVTIKEKNNQGVSGKLIILDPGHGTFNENGTYDRGCAGIKGTLESEVTLTLSKELGKILSSQGALVRYTRMDERKQDNIDLDGRVNFASKSGADAFVSLHFNAARDPEAQGTETYYYTNQSLGFAQKIHKRMIDAVKYDDRGVRQRGFYVCRKITSMPSVLLEPLFLSNKKGEEWIGNPDNLKKLAQAISDGIKDYFQEE
jgi:N-acetylmuramoyl-L-alanine amidase/uncharacterized protein YgiM (DUF1202 family)